VEVGLILPGIITGTPADVNHINKIANCQANPSFEPIASGGDGDAVQFWYVGYDPTLKTIIVAHQGTDFSELWVIRFDVLGY
jgi:hypothetical protein